MLVTGHDQTAVSLSEVSAVVVGYVVGTVFETERHPSINAVLPFESENGADLIVSSPGFRDVPKIK